MHHTGTLAFVAADAVPPICSQVQGSNKRKSPCAATRYAASGLRTYVGSGVFRIAGYRGGMTAAERARALLDLHTAPELLVLVNVWDVSSARTVAAQLGCRAIATASHSIAEAHGYEDGENIPVDLMLAAIERVVAAVDLPVTADLEAGYGDVGTTIRRAIGVGAVGGNLEDAMRPFADSVAAVRAAIAAGEAEGVPFVLNARTDAYLEAGDRDREAVFADAVERGRAFLAEGAACVFVPGVRDLPTVQRLVEALGERTISLIAPVGGGALVELERLGVARVSCGPYSQMVALNALGSLAAGLLAGGAFPPLADD
jgi:2-methylisocitrate lyase-like PEP mutase family enzyme